LEQAKDSFGASQAILNNIGRIKALRQVFARERPDRLISFLDRTNILVLLASLGLDIPVIVSERADPNRLPSKSVWGLLRRMVYPWAKQVVSLSMGVDACFSWLPAAKRTVIYNPLMEQRHDSKSVPSDLLQENRNYLVAMGRLVKEKGFDLLIRAFAEARRRHPDWSLLILGEGGEKPALLELAANLGLESSLFLPGWVDNPFPILKHCQLFVLSSRTEGFGNVLVEAMASGLPVISFDCPFGPREIIRDGIDGVLVAPENVEAMACAIDRLMADAAERARLSANAVDAMQRFSLDAIARQWEAILGMEHHASATPAHMPHPASTASILYIIGNLDIGGAERHLVKTLPFLARHDFQIEVYTLTHCGKQAPLLGKVGISVREPWGAACFRGWPTPFRQMALLPATLSSLISLILRSRPDILHFFLPVPYLLGGLCRLLTGKRISLMSRRNVNAYHLQQPWLAPLERWMHPHMDAILGNSQVIVEELIAEGVPSGRIGLIYNGVEPSPSPSLREETRTRLGLNTGDCFLLCAASLAPRKAHADLLHALANIQDQLPLGWRLGLAGQDAGCGAVLRDLAERLGIAGHVLWLGERSDVPALYQACDLGILCSHEEGFPNSLLEGMAAGTAMIATAVGGNAEALEDGLSGLIVPPKDPASLGQAILKLLGDDALRRQFGAAAHDRVSRLFSLEACADNYARLYRALLNHSNQPVMAMLQQSLPNY
jgi:glycosyltransferase involved in cell wall biosynthesis